MGRPLKPKPAPKGWNCELCLSEKIIVTFYTKRQQQAHKREVHKLKPGDSSRGRSTRHGRLNPGGLKPRTWPENETPEEAKKRRKPNE